MATTLGACGPKQKSGGACTTDAECGPNATCMITPGSTTGVCSSNDGTASETGDGSTGDTGDTAGEGTDGETTGGGGPVDAVDVLFVVDNSGSMGAYQGALGRDLAEFVATLDASDVDWRIGFTTTDNSNPWCGAATTPEAGALVASSCIERQGSFTNQQGTLDVYDLACSANCQSTTSELGVTTPWIERVDGAYNFTGDPAQVVGCLAPQGIDGCGFESQLESASKAVTRFETSGDPAFGFMRPEASLAIILLTDEADCSYEIQSIFEQDGMKTFWDDPADTFPTSAVCWNAGTDCTPNGAFYDCGVGNYDVAGNPVGPDDPGVVLPPVDGYLAQLEAIRAAKQAANPNASVYFGVIAGYDSSGVPVYADIADPTFMKDFGIGPGCSEQIDSIACSTDDQCTVVEGTCSGGACRVTATAVPPVRAEALQADFPPAVGASICTADYADTLSSWASLFVAGE